jgi:hypothetical protein
MKPSKFISIAAALLCAGAAFGAPAYKLTKAVPLGAPDPWDYLVFSAETGRVYVAHGDRVTVVDAASAEIVGQVEGIPGGAQARPFPPRRARASPMTAATGRRSSSI